MQNHFTLEDYHVHSHYSDDSIYQMEHVVLEAIAMGMQEICFTDHVDYGIKRDWDDPRGIEYRQGNHSTEAFANVNYPAYEREIYHLQAKYSKVINIKFGMEFGIQTHTIPLYEKLFSQYPFDFIILSIHQVEDKEFWTQDFQRGKSQQEYNLKYYEEMKAVINNYHNYSVLGHMDLITRYDPFGIYPFEILKPIITEILKQIISDGKGIEVNTSNYRYGLSDMTPSRNILMLYKELGGTIITIGSDCHHPSHLGKHIIQAKKELFDMGFRQYCTYDQMQPVFHNL